MRILVVDDDQMSRMMLVTFLQQFGRCDEARDGDEALTLFDRAVGIAPYDLVCLDIYMPNFDGQQTLLELRKIEKTYNPAKRTKVFMVSATKSIDDVSKAFVQGHCDDFVYKPFQPHDLLKLLKMHGIVKVSVDHA